mgnify:CR=1 FL=1|jgi:V8-like Glu-specific endopeptidase
MKSYRLPLFLFAASLLLAPLAFGQQGIQLIDHGVSSGLLSNQGNSESILWTDTVFVPTADSVQLKFDNVTFESDQDALIVTGLLDGHVQRLDRAALKLWQNHTAWFNGSAVAVAIELAPGSSGSVDIDHAYAEFASDLPDTICGASDNRVLSTDVRVCRVVPSGTSTCGWSGPCAASAFMISDTSTILTARHVAILSIFTIAQFGVPTSNATTGQIAHPSPADQYPIDQSSIVQSAASVVGDDWAVARLHPNSNGETAASRQGWFQLAASMPANGTTLRVTGFGIDDTPDYSRHHACQTATGPLTSVSGNQVNHQVDTTNGSSGSAVYINSSGLIVAIHTNAGCGATSGSNAATSIFNSGLQSAISQVTGCGGTTLNSGSSNTMTCTSDIFNVNPASNKWTGVAVSSLSDWDIAIESSPGSGTLVSSAFGGNLCDFVIANGRLGNVDPASGRIYRFSGSDNARGEAHDAIATTMSGSATTSFTASTIFRLFEFQVTSAGNYDMTVTGDSSLGWRLYAPGSNTNWRSRSDATTVTSAIVGSSTSQSVALGTGWHCLAVFRNGGAAVLNETVVSFSICPAVATLNVPLTTPTTVANPCQDFSITPQASVWNVVGIASDSSWRVVMGAGYSSSATNDTDFVVANGTLGAVTPSTGQFVRFSGTTSGVAQHRSATNIAVGSSPALAALASGQVLVARSFNVTTAGAYEVSVTGASGGGLFWRIFAPGADASWRPRNDALSFANFVGSAPVSYTLGTGNHLIVAYRNGEPATTSESLMFHVCSAAPVVLSGISVLTVPNPCASFSCTPDADRFNAVGVSSLSDWDLAMGPSYSRLGGTGTDFVFANGHLGTITPTEGVAARWSGSEVARLQRSFNVTLSLSSTYNANWPSDYVVRMFEFEITTPRTYDITLSNAAEISWILYAPGTDAGWRARNESALASGSANGSTSTVLLQPGWYGIAVFRDGGAAAGTLPFTVRVEPTPNPTPVVNSLSPNNVTAGAPGFTLTVGGAAFVSGCVVRWNGANLPTSFVNANQVTATVPAGNVNTAGTASISVFNPAPGGGLSNNGTFTINNPLPTLTSLNPNLRVAGGAGFTLTLNGTGYNNQTVARWNGANLATTFINAFQVSANISAAQIANPGTANVTAFNPGPGGGSSGGLPFTISHPNPTISGILPSSAVVGGPSFLLTVNGSGYFTGSSVVRWNGANLPTTFVNSTQLTATVSAALIAANGTASVRVFNPAPGGGQSGIVNFQIQPPIIASIAPATIAVMNPLSAPVVVTITGSNFLPGTVAYANSQPLPTNYVNPTTVTCQVGPGVLQTQLVGGIALAVENSLMGWSNAVALRVGTGSNVGTIVRHPLNPPPGTSYSAFLAGGYPSAPYTIIVDATNPAPVHPFPTPVEGFVLSVRPLTFSDPTWFVFDGIGIYGPPIGLAFQPNGTANLPGFVAPNPPAGVNLTVQSVFLDPTAPSGFRMMWARYPDSL